MASVSLNHIYKVYAGNVTAVSDFNLDIEDKEFIVLVGPSGCGKSTTLRMRTRRHIHSRHANRLAVFEHPLPYQDWAKAHLVPGGHIRHKRHLQTFQNKCFPCGKRSQSHGYVILRVYPNRLFHRNLPYCPLNPAQRM